MSVTRYDKETLGPNTGRGSGGKAWMRWHRRVGGEPVRIENPGKYLHSVARYWIGFSNALAATRDAEIEL